jgi:hypothetical protein
MLFKNAQAKTGNPGHGTLAQCASKQSPLLLKTRSGGRTIAVLNKARFPALAQTVLAAIRHWLLAMIWFVTHTFLSRTFLLGKPGMGL